MLTSVKLFVILKKLRVLPIKHLYTEFVQKNSKHILLTSLLMGISLQYFAKFCLETNMNHIFFKNNFEKINSEEIALENFMVRISHSKFLYNTFDKK